MTDKKISALPAAAALTGTELAAVVQAGQTRRATAQQFADLAGVASQRFVPLQLFGAHPGGSFDNTAAIQEVVDYAQSIGATVAPTLGTDPADRWYIEGRVDWKNVDFIGNGPLGTLFECVDPDAGFDFTKYGDPHEYTGLTGNFGILGGPSGGNGIAHEPLVIGLRVNARFSNILSWYADPDDGINLQILALQNSMLDTMWLIDGYENCRFDAGAANNLMLKSEIAAAYFANLTFRSVKESPPFQFDYTIYNTVQDTICEGSYASTEHMVYSEDGALNHLIRCPITVNGDVFGGVLPDDMVQVVYAELGESGQSSLVMQDCEMDAKNVADVMIEAESGCRVEVTGGSMGRVPLGLRGAIKVHAWPWMFSTVTDWKDDDLSFPQTVMHEMGVPNVQWVESDAETWQIMMKRGETSIRYQVNGVGLTAWGSGAAPADVTIGRSAAGVLAVGGQVYASGLTKSSTGLAVPTAAMSTIAAANKVMAVYNNSTNALVGYVAISPSFT